MAKTQEEVIAFLSNGTSYGLPRTRVVCMETHCSVIFLVGPYAYKLKRPVAFSALDFTTIDRRGAACRAELELNRRTAPELYLGVHTICRRPDGRLTFDGDGQVLDWVVAMRRFDQADLFDHLADRGILSPELMRALADEIVWFHGRAEQTFEFGGAAGLGKALEQTSRDLKTVEAILPKGAVGELRAASTGYLARIAPVLDRRRQEGKVRRCHGDLRLANICLVDERPTLFDAIEFNDEVSNIDVLFDLAFLLMELHQRRLDAFANIVFNRYIDATGNLDGLTALPLMLAARAANRAYSLAFAVERQTEPGAAQQLKSAAQSHVASALAMLGTFPARLVAIGGLAGSHKKELAHRLAAQLGPPPGARILHSDSVRKKLLELPARSRLPPTAYAPEMNDGVYAAIAKEAMQVLNVGSSVVVDASFMQPAQREAIAQVASSLSAPFVGVWIGDIQDMEVSETNPVENWQILKPDFAVAAATKIAPS